ncbi:hypothetical protein AWC38_SpisGene487 [Stylophora pistillata]|uniref:EGF-like domain-containing protein n=1 Tax=Stylophora pistillata TaxID=50429 RepID=A0A2B4SZ90_STYPI|nr:hypothetical protein AWC38_SpisGene487 [Stylophora pistillata]
MRTAELVICILFFLQVKGDCPSESCQKISLDVHQDSMQDTEFVGHVFHKYVTLNPVQCYIRCIRDCRCLSINYKENPQNDIKYCELNEGNHFISNNALVKSPGSKYFVLRKEYSKVKTNSINSSCANDVMCTNGCCKNNLCLNGGTCIEMCEPSSVRYNCSCPVPFVGKHCETQLKRSCQDYKAAGSTASGLYTLNDDNSQTFQVFCDFDSEPGFAWNLIESFSLSNNHRFQKNIVFYDDYQAISGDAPNWQAYLIERPYLLWLRNQSTHWRATCRYNTDGTVYTDYLRASLEDFDIIRDVPTVVNTCRPYEYVNIRGNECENCTAATWYKKGVIRLHIDSSCSCGCDFDGSKTDAAISSEDNFGYYGAKNPKFRCTSNQADTTQFWIGSK